MPTYAYGREALHCERGIPPLPLPGIAPPRGDVIRLTRGGRECCPPGGAGDCNLDFPGHCGFAVNDDCTEIRLLAGSGRIARGWRHLLLDHTLPRVLDGRGRLVLHAGAVAVGGQAIAFVGATGTGKSTLCAHFHRSGDSLLTDDGLIAQAGAAGVDAVPTYRSLRLWPDSLGRTFAAGTSTARAAGPPGKLQPALDGADAPPAVALPLAAVFLLRPADGHAARTRRLAPGEACMALIANTFQLRAADPRRAAERLDQAAGVCRSTPVYTLAYPRDFTLLNRVRGAVLECVEGHPATAAAGGDR